MTQSLLDTGHDLSQVSHWSVVTVQAPVSMLGHQQPVINNMAGLQIEDADQVRKKIKLKKIFSFSEVRV